MVSKRLPNNQILEKAERPATEKEYLPIGKYIRMKK